MRGLDDHIDYLTVVLLSGTIMPEERFDRLADEHLRTYGRGHLLAQAKEQLILRQHAYRLELRGRPYLACLRHAGEIGNLKVVTAHDVMTLLDKLARLADEQPPAKRREKMW